MACAFSAAFQKSGAVVCSSSSAMRRRLPAMSKMPPENFQSALQLRQTFSQGADFHGGKVEARRTIAPRSGARSAKRVPAIVFLQADVLGGMGAVEGLVVGG